MKNKLFNAIRISAIVILAFLTAFAFFFAKSAEQPIVSAAELGSYDGEGTFEMLNEAALRLDGDGYAFRAKISKDLYEDIAADQTKRLFFIIIPAGKKATVNGHYYKTIYRNTDTESADFGEYVPAMSHCVYVEPVVSELIDDSYYKLQAGVKNLTSLDQEKYDYFAVACIETRTDTRGQVGGKLKYDYTYANLPYGESEMPETNVYDVALMHLLYDYSACADSLADNYAWFGSEDFPIEVDNQTDYDALVDLFETDKSFVENLYYDVDCSVVTTDAEDAFCENADNLNAYYPFTIASNGGMIRNGGEEISSINIEKGAYVSDALSALTKTKADNTFYKWRYSTDGVNYSDLGSGVTATSAMTVKAIWYADHTDYTGYEIANTDIDLRTAGVSVSIDLNDWFDGADVVYAKVNSTSVTTELSGDDALITVADLALGESTVVLLACKGEEFRYSSIALTKATAVLTTKADVNAMSSLAAAADARENYWGGYFVLGANIDFGGTAVTTVAAYRSGDDGKGFVGTFDGRGHVIDNMTVGYWGWGMFGGLGSGSVIKNVSLTNVAHPGYTALLSISAGNVDISNIYVHYKSINYPGTGDATGMLLGTIWGGSVRNVVVDITKPAMDFSDKGNADALVFNNKGDYFTNCYVIGSDSIKLSWANASFTTGRYASWDAFVAAGNDLSSFSDKYWEKVDGKLYGERSFGYLGTYLLTDITVGSQATISHDYDRGVGARATVNLSKGMITKNHRVYICTCHTNYVRYSGLNLSKDALIALKNSGKTKVRVGFADESGVSSDITITANFGTRKSITIPGGHGWDYTSYVLEIPLQEVIDNYDTISVAWYAMFSVTNTQVLNLGISDMVIA